MNAITPERRKVKRKLDLDLFDEITRNMGLHLDSLRADAMDIHPSLISKVRAGEVRPGRKFIEGVLSLGIPYTAVFVEETSDGN